MKAIKYFLSFVLFFVLFLLLTAFITLFKPNTLNENELYLHVKTGTTLQQLILEEEFQLIIYKTATFKWASKLKKFEKPKPGRYKITAQMNNQELINLLRSGIQEPVVLSWSYVKSLPILAGKVSQVLEADSLELYNMFTSASLAQSKGFELETFGLMFLPNTYEFFWNTSASQFIERMQKEYQTFWNTERLNLAEQIKLSPIEVGVLASIVQSETAKADEMPIVSGLYINRLQQDIKLQADPTVIFAIRNDQPHLEIKRVLTRDLSYDSPYNTYVYSGLPPGPIRLPSTTAIDAVLKHKKHKHIYMCADPERPGYHKFTHDYNQHLLNGRMYHQWANKMNIKR